MPKVEYFFLPLINFAPNAYEPQPQRLFLYVILYIIGESFNQSWFSTNASAESFNAKIKAFRVQFRGVKNVEFFLFRLTEYLLKHNIWEWSLIPLFAKELLKNKKTPDYRGFFLWPWILRVQIFWFRIWLILRNLLESITS